MFNFNQMYRFTKYLSLKDFTHFLVLTRSVPSYYRRRYCERVVAKPSTISHVGITVLEMIIENDRVLPSSVSMKQQILKESINRRGDRDIRRIKILLAEPHVFFKYILDVVEPNEKNQEVVKLLLGNRWFLKGTDQKRLRFLYKISKTYLDVEVIEMLLTIPDCGHCLTPMYRGFWKNIIKYVLCHKVLHVFDTYFRVHSYSCDQLVWCWVVSMVIKRIRCEYDISLLRTFVSIVLQYTQGTPDDFYLQLVLAIIQYGEEGESLSVTELLHQHETALVISPDLGFFVSKYGQLEMWRQLLSEGAYNRFEPYTSEHFMIQIITQDYHHGKLFMKYGKVPDCCMMALLSIFIRSGDVKATNEVVMSNKVPLDELAYALLYSVECGRQSIFEIIYTVRPPFVFVADHDYDNVNIYRAVMRHQGTPFYEYLKTLPEICISD